LSNAEAAEIARLCGSRDKSGPSRVCRCCAVLRHSRLSLIFLSEAVA